RDDHRPAVACGCGQPAAVLQGGAHPVPSGAPVDVHTELTRIGVTMPHGRSMGRRSLLGLATVTCLAACAPAAQAPAPRARQEEPLALQPVTDVDGLLGLDRFVVGHRGSGDNWPEHTLTA